LGLRQYLEGNGHTFIVTSDKDGPNSVLERELADAEVIISQPFWPAYMTAERIAELEAKSFYSPDETREFAGKGHMNIVKVGALA
jgi:hypothetical protein